MNGWQLDYDTVRRLAEMRRKDKIKSIPAINPVAEYRSDSRSMFNVEITSGTPTAHGYYPGKLYLYDVATHAWEEQDDIYVLVLEVAFHTIALGEKYHGNLIGVVDEGSGDRLLYTVEVPPTFPTEVTTSGNSPGPLTDNMRFEIGTRGSPLSISSSGFSADRWAVEVENDGVDYSTGTDPYSGVCTYGRYTKTSSTGQFLICQWLRRCPYRFYQSRIISFQMSLRSNSARTVKAGFFLWSGTGDAMATPLVSSWAYPHPTWTVDLTTSTSDVSVGTSFGYWNVWTLGLTFENLGVVIWTDDMTAGDYLDVTEAALFVGSSFVTPYPRRWELDEIACTQHAALGGLFN